MQTINHFFQRNNQIQNIHIIIYTPTKTTTYNISKYTLHTTFLLPINIKNNNNYIPLSKKKLTSLKKSIKNIKILIINKISIIKSNILLTIHHKLYNIIKNHQPFKKISILTIKNLLQLPPITQKPIFSYPSNKITTIYKSL